MEKSVRDRENVGNTTDENEAVISHYGIFFKLKYFFGLSLHSTQNVVFLHPVLSL